MAKLVAQSGPTAGKEYPIAKDVIVLGRQSTCDVQLIDNMASRAHCQIRRYGDFLVLSDSGSRNGTKLNDQRVIERQLEFGDRIRVGEVVMMLVKEDGDKELKDLLTRYRVESKLGEGGMGVVYKAVQVSMQRPVALKVLSPKYAARPRFVEQFIREARAAGALNHQNVIQVHDVGTENGVHFFSMEHVEGPTCARMLRSQGCFETDEALEVILQVAKALEYAHEHRLIHQDIKPDNIMVGSDNVVKLADLGISKTFDEAEQEGDESRKIMGTPHYMAPEAALGKKIDHRVDIYGLGATLYHLLAGKVPFHGEGATEVLKKVVMEEPPPLRQLNPKVTDAVEKLVRRLMAKQPDARPQTAVEVQAEIKKLWDGNQTGSDRVAAGDTQLLRRYIAAKDLNPSGEASLQTPEPRTGSRLATAVPAGTRMASWLLIGAVAVLALVGVAALALGGGKPPPQEPPAPPQPATTAAVAPAPRQASPQEEAAARATRSLDELERLLGKPANQVDPVAAHNLLAAVPQSGLDPAQSERRRALAARLDLVAQRARQNQLEASLTALQTEVDRLADERNYDLALGRLDAFPARTDPALRDRVAQKRMQLVQDKAEFAQKLDERTRRMQASRDLAGLNNHLEHLPKPWLGSPQAQAIEAAIKTVQAERLTLLDGDANQCAKALAQWDFATFDRLVASRLANAQGTPAGQRLTQYAEAAKRLRTLAATLDAPLTKAGGMRYKGTLNGFADPDLTGASEDGLGLKERHGGQVDLAWSKLKPAELAAIIALALGKTEADTWAGALATLDQARQVK